MRRAPFAVVNVVAGLALALAACSGGTTGEERGTAARPTPPAAAPITPARPGEPAVVLHPDGRAPVRVTVELARTPGERARGLMYRQHLPPEAGMLFVFETDEVQEFWMKNTLIPLDMIFIRADLTVAGVVESAEPLTLVPRSIPEPSRYVLEVNGGWARAHGIEPGTRVTFEHVDALPPPRHGGNP